MVRMEYSRLLKQCISILFFAALMHSAFAQQHGILPITTTETSYTLVDNSFTDGDTASGVRLSFEASKTGIFKVTFTPASSSYNLYKCPDNTFTLSLCSFVRVLSGTNAWSETFFAGNGQAVYYLIKAYNSVDPALPFSVVYEDIALLLLNLPAEVSGLTSHPIKASSGPSKPTALTESELPAVTAVSLALKVTT